MRSRKGFTLIELLAVIAILAILVIIAIPGIIKIFNNARKEVFLNEARTVFKEGNKKIATSSYEEGKITSISSKNNDLDINKDGYVYRIKYDNEGNVTDFRVSSKDFCIRGSFSDINDLTSDKVETEACDVYDYSPSPTWCTYDGDLVQGAEFIQGQYTYRYKQIWVGTEWRNKNIDGWGVTLTDKESTEPVTSKVCTAING